MTGTKKEVELLVLDLDNTLYDWFSFFVPSFYAMIEVAASRLGCSQRELLAQARAVHQRHHDIEHPFALLETEAAQELIRSSSVEDAVEKLDPAFHAFNRERIRTLQLYPGVRETLEAVQRLRIDIVAYSEGKKHSVMDRLRRLEIDHYFSRVFCRKSSESLHPNPERAQEIAASYPKEKLCELPVESKKPDPQVLHEICAQQNCRPEQAAYVGDSLARDILMAQDAGVLAIWASYGDLSKRQGYEKLVAISHWTEEDVRRARELGRLAKDVVPDAIIDTFSELLEVISPVRDLPRVATG